MSTKEAILRDSSSHAQLLAQITELDYVPPALQHKNTYIATLEKKLIELENQISTLKQTAIKKERQKHEAMRDTNEATTDRIVAKITRRKEKVETKASKEKVQVVFVIWLFSMLVIAQRFDGGTRGGKAGQARGGEDENYDCGREGGGRCFLFSNLFDY
jgi:hypothetical protein